MDADDEDDDDIDDEEMTMMVRRFKKFFKRKGRFQRGEFSYKKEMAPVFFESKKPGHFKAECPSLQRFKEKDKESLCRIYLGR